MRAVLIVLGVLNPAIGLMMAFVEFYSARGGSNTWIPTHGLG